MPRQLKIMDGKIPNSFPAIKARTSFDLQCIPIFYEYFLLNAFWSSEPGEDLTNSLYTFAIEPYLRHHHLLHTVHLERRFKWAGIVLWAKQKTASAFAGGKLTAHTFPSLFPLPIPFVFRHATIKGIKRIKKHTRKKQWLNTSKQVLCQEEWEPRKATASN